MYISFRRSSCERMMYSMPSSRFQERRWGSTTW